MNKNEVPSVFEGFKLRKIWHEEEWYFSVVDIIYILTDSVDAQAYWRKLKQRESQLVTICHGFKLKAKDGKLRETDCVTFQNALRLIQSIPSKRAEPFKLWLASLGQAETYRQQGYDEEWIEQRMKSKLARYELTDEWSKRNVSQGKEFAILTNIIAKKTFDKTIQEHKNLKNLDVKENLRDNMSDLELLFSTLGERVTKEITVKKEAQGFNDCKTAANSGGSVAGRARKDAEKAIGESIITNKNKKDIVLNNNNWQ